MGGLIIPNRYVSIEDSTETNNDSINEKPLIFLAGPIRGAPNWQDEAANYILSKEPNILVVSPRRGIRPSISKYVLEGDENHFSRQRSWERHYINLTYENGCMLFWLAGETDHSCDKSYGAMTRFELGHLAASYSFNNKIKLVIGGDGNFSELDTIKVDLELDVNGKSRVYDTLEETCEKAIEFAITTNLSKSVTRPLKTH